MVAHVVIARTFAARTAAGEPSLSVVGAAGWPLVTQGPPATPSKLMDIGGRTTVRVPETEPCAPGGPRVGVVRDIAVDAVPFPAHASVYTPRPILAIEEAIQAASGETIHGPKVAALTAT